MSRRLPQQLALVGAFALFIAQVWAEPLEDPKPFEVGTTQEMLVLPI